MRHIHQGHYGHAEPSQAELASNTQKYVKIPQHGTSRRKTSSRGLDLLLAFYGCRHTATDAVAKGQRMPRVIFSCLTTNGLWPPCQDRIRTNPGWCHPTVPSVNSIRCQTQGAGAIKTVVCLSRQDQRGKKTHKPTQGQAAPSSGCRLMHKRRMYINKV